MINDRDDDDLIDEAIQARLYDLKTMLLGRVQAYNAAQQTVTVKPVQGTYKDGDAAPFSMLPDVPVAFPRFGGGSLTFPLGSGDFVLLLFSSRATDAFVVDGIEDDPQSPRYGHLSDAVALPLGVSPASLRLPNASATDVTLTQAVGGSILFGDGATLGAARVTDPVAVASAWAAWFTAVGSFVGTPPPIDPTIGNVSSGSAVVKIA